MASDNDLLNSVENILGMEEPDQEEGTDIAIRDFKAPVVFEPNQGEQEMELQAWDDYVYTRNTLQQLIETGQKALEGALDAAFTSHHPRAYEVAGAIMKQIAETTTHLIKLRKQFRDGNPPAERSTKPDVPSGGNTFIFNGTTDGMADMMSGVMEQAKAALEAEGRPIIDVEPVEEEEGGNALAE